MGRSRKGSATGGVYGGAGSSSLPLCLLDHMDTFITSWKFGYRLGRLME